MQMSTQLSWLIMQMSTQHSLVNYANEYTTFSVVRAQQTLQRLDEIALKPNPLSQVEYIDLLIQCEKDEDNDGYPEHIQYLNQRAS